jgi:hypothetical protein
MKLKNRKGEAISAQSYQEFIVKVVTEHGGIVRDDKLDEMIEEAYGKHWGPTDLKPWGRQRHPKWKQNVASAKSGLDRRGVVVRFERTEAIPISRREPGWKVTKQRNGQLFRIVRHVYRVLLPEPTFLRAYDQWCRRMPPKQKKNYEKLDQPIQVDFVPE